MHCRHMLTLAIATVPATWIAAQQVPAPAAEQVPAREAERIAKALAQEQAAATKAIRTWVAEYSAGKFRARDGLVTAVHDRPDYMCDARWAGLLTDDDIARLTHLDLLQRLLFFAEKHASTELADAILGVAGVGLQGTLHDRTAMEIRDSGHWALMRTKHQGAWYLILRAAAGERVPILDELRPVDTSKMPVSIGPARRVAALRLIGQRGLPVFRSTLEAALLDRDPRVRLAAVEAIVPDYRVPTIERIATRIASERHPVVSQALVQLLMKMLKRPPRTLRAAAKQRVVERAVAQLGRVSWRTDLDLLDLVEEFPYKSAIPHLIDTLDAKRRPIDKLVKAVNKRAPERLRHHAGELLQAMTGALIQSDDPDAWRAFWAKQQDHIVIPQHLSKPKPNGTQASFFNIPITGTSIAFLTDTSGSMIEPPTGKGPTTGRDRTRQARTRLRAAKEQLALATQAMPSQSHYYVMTFADKATTWTPKPLRPNRHTSRSLTGLMSKLHATGGTNLFAGLVFALEMDNRSYSQDTEIAIDELFVLSDGEPTVGDIQDPTVLLRMVREANKYAKVRINCVFTGSGKGAELLRLLAEQNGGVFVQR